MKFRKKYMFIIVGVVVGGVLGVIKFHPKFRIEESKLPISNTLKPDTSQKEELPAREEFVSRDTVNEELLALMDLKIDSLTRKEKELRRVYRQLDSIVQGADVKSKGGIVAYMDSLIHKEQELKLMVSRLDSIVSIGNKKLARAIEYMEPTNVAVVMDSLDDNLVLGLLLEMKERNVGRILSALPPNRVAAVFKKLNELKCNE